MWHLGTVRKCKMYVYGTTYWWRTEKIPTTLGLGHTDKCFWFLQRIGSKTGRICLSDMTYCHQRAGGLFICITIHIRILVYVTCWGVKVKVKCTLVQALRLCRGRTAHRGIRGIALLFHDHSTRRGWGVSVTPRPLFTPGKDPVPIV